MWTVVVCLALTAPAAEPASLLTELTATGLDLPGGPRFKLPAPSMARGLADEKKAAVVEQFAKEFPRGLFVEKESTAPHVLTIEAITGDDKKRRGHRLDLWFVAHGKLDQLDRQNMLGTLMGMQGKASKEPAYLTAKELEARKITPTDAKGVEERFVRMDLPLIDKVQLSGVLRSQKLTEDGALISAMTLDPRFADDKDYPNRWRHIKENFGEPAGFGPPVPYSGFGGYIKATPVPGKGDMVFVEMHFVFAEPHEWFDGRNLLASKLPLAVASNVKNVRRKLAGK